MPRPAGGQVYTTSRFPEAAVEGAELALMGWRKKLEIDNSVTNLG